MKELNIHFFNERMNILIETIKQSEVLTRGFANHFNDWQFIVDSVKTIKTTNTMVQENQQFNNNPPQIKQIIAP